MDEFIRCTYCNKKMAGDMPVAVTSVIKGQFCCAACSESYVKDYLKKLENSIHINVKTANEIIHEK